VRRRDVFFCHESVYFAFIDLNEDPDIPCMVEDTKEKKEKEQTLAIYNMLQLQNLYI
jgi:hypothetical protein